jgi:hypothetical protein
MRLRHGNVVITKKGSLIGGKTKSIEWGIPFKECCLYHDVAPMYSLLSNGRYKHFYLCPWDFLRVPGCHTISGDLGVQLEELFNTHELIKRQIEINYA